jgi:hypothetical protein
VQGGWPDYSVIVLTVYHFATTLLTKCLPDTSVFTKNFSPDRTIATCFKLKDQAYSSVSHETLAEECIGCKSIPINCQNCLFIADVLYRPASQRKICVHK